MTGQQLVERLAAWIGQWVRMSQGQTLVVALWILHTYAIKHAHATPYLEVWARAKRCGKTILLEVLEALSPLGPAAGQRQATIRTLPMARMIREYDGACVIFLDEAERLEANTLGDTRSMLAAGYRHGAVHPVSVGQRTTLFPTYCAKAFALIGNIQPILRDRSLPVELRRADPVRNWTAEYVAAITEAETLREAIRATLRTAHSTPGMVNIKLPIVVPVFLRGRDQEISTAIWSMALALDLHKPTLELLASTLVDMAWSKTLPACDWRAVQDDRDEDECYMSDRVLPDLVSVLDTDPDERNIASTDAVARLRAMPVGPWRGWRGGIDELKLAALLSRYVPTNQTIQIGHGRKGRKVVKGYSKAVLRAALAKVSKVGE